MKIWLINHYAVPPSYYPLARQYHFAKQLMKMGHEVTIFAASTVHNSNVNLMANDKRLFKDEYVDDVHYVYINCHQYIGNGIKRIINMIEFAKKLPKVCSHYEKPHAIVATSVTPMACAKGIRIAKRYQCKGIAEIADLWPESIVAYGIAGKRNPAVLALRILEKWIYKNADRVVFTMEGAYDYIQELKWEQVVPLNKVAFINNGIDLQEFQLNCKNYIVEDCDLANEDICKVVFTGSIRKVNNIGRIIDIAKQIKNPKIRFLIWGDGDEKDKLVQRVCDEKIDNVVFKGYVDKRYIPYIVSQADINILHNDTNPILRFGLSLNKLFDYLAAGKPVFTDFTCSYNPAEVYGAGITASSDDIKEIAECLEKMATISGDEYRRLCDNALIAAKKYDFCELTKKLIQVINDIQIWRL